jgi:DNA-binding GntR family transcriptional regulator
VRLDACPDIERVDFTLKSLFGVLEGEYGLVLASGRRTFAAQGAPPVVAEALGVSAGNPVLYLEQVTYLQDATPVEYSDVWIRSDRLKLSSLLTREATKATGRHR